MDDIITEYYEISTKINTLTKRKAELRLKLIEAFKDGYDLKSSGVTVSERFAYNMKECEEKYVKLTGLKPPILIVPSHEEINFSLFEQLLKKSGIEKSMVGYTVRRR